MSGLRSEGHPEGTTDCRVDPEPPPNQNDDGPESILGLSSSSVQIYEEVIFSIGPQEP
jgi:hypothetical protein